MSSWRSQPRARATCTASSAASQCWRVNGTSIRRGRPGEPDSARAARSRRRSSTGRRAAATTSRIGACELPVGQRQDEHGGAGAGRRTARSGERAGEQRAEAHGVAADGGGHDVGGDADQRVEHGAGAQGRRRRGGQEHEQPQRRPEARCGEGLVPGGREGERRAPRPGCSAARARPRRSVRLGHGGEAEEGPGERAGQAAERGQNQRGRRPAVAGGQERPETDRHAQREGHASGAERDRRPRRRTTATRARAPAEAGQQRGGGHRRGRPPSSRTPSREPSGPSSRL